MLLRENVPLAPLTTLRVGGAARFFIEARTEEEVSEAIAFARERALPLFVLGRGSNVLVPDTGIDGVVLKMRIDDIAVEDAGEQCLIDAGAGALWDAVVDAASAAGAFGIENLAGIPGTAGGAAVQNIGAYGAELAPVFEHAEVIESTTGERRRIERDDAAFGYRASAFKTRPGFIITRVALRLAKHAVPNLAYPDLIRAREAGAPLETPADIAHAIRAIRAEKFPCLREGGTAGSFFKNPVVSPEIAASLTARYPGLPSFPQEDGRVKVPLAWLLDRALALKGHTRGPVRLYERQPLVLVAREGACAAEVDAFAHDIATRVRDAIGISVEREVETFGTRA